MTKELDRKFIIIKRKATLQGDYHSKYNYTRPFLEHTKKTKVGDKKIAVDFDNRDVFYAARKAGYETGDKIEYEIKIPIKNDS